MTATLQDRHYQVALTFIPMVGAVTAKTLVSYCGGPEAVFHANKRELLKIPGIGPQIADSILSSEVLSRAEHELVFMEKHGIETVFYTEPRFPVRLRQNADAPSLLYFKGSSLDLLNAGRVLSIVGTRQPSELGRAVCEEIVEGLKPYNIMIVSGLAYGIDVTAHKKANTMGIANIGVLGHGLGRLYPEAHRSVAQKMIEHGGLLSEYPHPTMPDRENFPMRNRIIAGLSDALLVVETANSGGSMISAALAGQYSREVLAIPGRVRDPKSVGCNQLIKSDRARLVESAMDIASIMKWDAKGDTRATQTRLFLDLSPIETNIVDLVRQKPEIAIDELSFALPHSPGQLASILLGLEFKNVLRTLPGKRYVVA